MKISQILKDIRQQNQLTQEALAERLKVSRSAIARWESEKGIPDIGNLIAISREFDISLDTLIKEDERLEKKVIEDSKAKKWHYLVILYLFPSWFILVSLLTCTISLWLASSSLLSSCSFTSCASLSRKRFGGRRITKRNSLDVRKPRNFFYETRNIVALL